MKSVTQERIVEGLKYKTIGNLNPCYRIVQDVEILKVTSKSVTYKIDNRDPETDRLGKYKDKFNLPDEAEESDIKILEDTHTRSQNSLFIRTFKFHDLSDTQLAGVVNYLRNL